MSYNVQIRTVSEFKHCAHTHHRVLPHWSEVVSRDHLSAHLHVCVLLAIITTAMDTSLADIINGDMTASLTSSQCSGTFYCPFTKHALLLCHFCSMWWDMSISNKTRFFAIFCYFSSCHHSKAIRAPSFPLGL